MAEVIGTDNQDNLDGTGGADNITGKRGDDFIFGLGGDDIVNYFTHTDVSTSDGSDIVDGGDGYDRLRVFSDQHFWFVGSNSATQPMTFALQKGADGFAHFISSQNWANYPSTDPSTS